MSEILSFTEIYDYDTLKIGITVPTKLFFGENFVRLEAKVDTGAENCIFERTHAERLNIDVESGDLIIFNTAAGNFAAYGHELTLSVLGIETYAKVFFAKEESFTRNVLGRQGWLDRVKLGLIDYEGKLLLSAYDK
ncbi:MAG: hypothetical protein LH614_22105 [Pyrinomonadaceae bacterium]|nr:hypothetical protein [Pyrinomonadaceae bacterium]